MLVTAWVVRGKDRVITGEINDEQLKRISDLKQQHPEFKEIIDGPVGYKSPYRTIEQIAQDRKSGVIHPSGGVSYSGLFTEDITDLVGDNETTTPTPAPVAKPVVETTPAPVAKPVVETTKNGRPIIKVGKPVAETIPAPVTEPVVETAKSDRPIIKVGKPVEKAEETAKKTTEKAEETAKETTLKAGKPIDEIKTATPVKKVAEETGEIVKDVTEVVAAGEEAEDKLYEKGEKKLEKEEEKAKEKLVEAFAEAEKKNEKNARMLSASGRAPVDSPFKKRIVSGLTEITGKEPGRTTVELLEAAENLSRGVLTAMKDGKNLRLAGTAALLSVAGFAIGKRRDQIKKGSFEGMDIDEEQELKRSLMSDG